VDAMVNQSKSEQDEFGTVLEQLRKTQAAMRVCVRAIQDARGRAWEWRDRRDELRGNQPLVHDEISEQRNARDELNAEVQRLKTLRDEELEKARALQEKLQALRERGGPHKTLVSREELQRRFRELEWKQQTTPLSIDEERALIEEMESLSKAMETAPQANPTTATQSDEADSLWQQAQRARDNAQEHHETMIALVEEAQKKHQNIVQLSQSFGPSRTEIDEAHQMYVQCLQEADEMRERLEVLRVQEAELQQRLDSIRNQRNEARKAREKAAMDKLAEQARAKQKTGQKLTMQELRALMEADGME
jgi:uncharacterized coiled-coil DUF342 family protein